MRENADHAYGVTTLPHGIAVIAAPVLGICFTGGVPMSEESSVDATRDEQDSGTPRGTTLTPCDYCKRGYPLSELVPITTILNGVEKKEWVCSDCEQEAREDEKPPVRTDGGAEPSADATRDEQDSAIMHTIGGSNGCPVCGEKFHLSAKLTGSFPSPDSGEWCYDHGRFIIHETLKWDNGAAVGMLEDDGDE